MGGDAQIFRPQFKFAKVTAQETGQTIARRFQLLPVTCPGDDGRFACVETHNHLGGQCLHQRFNAVACLNRYLLMLGSRFGFRVGQVGLVQHRKHRCAVFEPGRRLPDRLLGIHQPDDQIGRGGPARARA